MYKNLRLICMPRAYVKLMHRIKFKAKKGYPEILVNLSSVSGLSYFMKKYMEL